MIYRRDSFITHRAFCDALAEESAKTQTVEAPPGADADPKLQSPASSPPPPPPPPPPPAAEPAPPAPPPCTAVIQSSSLHIETQGTFVSTLLLWALLAFGNLGFVGLY